VVNYNELYALTKNLKVLYVEDDIKFQAETAEMLAYFFDTIDLASNGVDALKKYKEYYSQHQCYYNILLSDINMPKMNGIELCKEIYAISESQTVLILSAHDESHYLLELLNMGVEQFLMKPIEYDKIIEVISAITQKHSPLDATTIDNKLITLSKNIFWDKDTVTLIHNSRKIKLTKKETLLMHSFTKNGSKIVTNELLLSTLWNKEEHLASQDTLTQIISRFRKKVPELVIKNIYGFGYKLVF